MFDWFKKKDYSNVIKFPEVKTPYIETPKEITSKTYYTFGVTDDNRLAFTMGYTTLTMNRPGVQNLIDQLEFFRDQLNEEEE